MDDTSITIVPEVASADGDGDYINFMIVGLMTMGMIRHLVQYYVG